MRRRLSQLAALSLLLSLSAAWPVQPIRTTTLARSNHVAQASDWTSLRPAIDAQRQWYAAAATPPVTVSPRPRARSGTIGAAATNGDRFDRLAMCESGMRQDAVDPSGSFLSYFQWRLSTWHAAGGTGDPRDVDYGTQKAIAMDWAQRANPSTQWPVCWPRSA